MRPTLVLIPGLGVDGRLFDPQRSLPFDIITPVMPDPLPFESIAHYAWRLTRDIEPRKNLWLGGMSFGGMLALEAARYLKPRGVFLIASTRFGSNHALLFRWLAYFTSSISTRMIRKLLYTAPLLVRIVGRPNREQRKLLLKLVDDAHLSVTRWGARAAMNYVYTGELRCPIYQIHGEIDRLVPVQNVTPDAIVKDAGHVVNVTQAQAVNNFLAMHICAHGG
jgi:pimeloyl-ACP methyl ester carboxylesterase